MRWQLVTWITVWSTNLSDYLLKYRPSNYTFNSFGKMAVGSLGRNFHNYLVENKISYKPNLIRHDLKHILLNYKMEMMDELRIHAFLIGNRSYNLLSMVYLGLCLLIVPEVILKLKKDYLRGKNTPCLKRINLEKFAHLNLNECRQKLAISQ